MERDVVVVIHSFLRDRAIPILKGIFHLYYDGSIPMLINQTLGGMTPSQLVPEPHTAYLIKLEEVEIRYQ